MYAWVLALLSLVHTDPGLLGAKAPRTELAVYLSTSPNQPAAPVDTMKRELSAIMQSAGYRVLYRDPRAPDPQAQFSALVVLEMRGTCGMPFGNYRLERAVASGASLAETSVSDGIVMPFSRINCANLTRLIGPVLADEAGAQRDYLYGRALARVAAHELYHVMMGSREHAHQGMAKASFSVNDLLDDRFEFDRAALVLMRRKAAAWQPIAPAGADSGR
ncbi:MAG TPA: hypothetical protein VMB03_22975 [Bryobacteraceae bacterium]|nr:hypothetical protein [Bryobacteraceae bacterium]